MICIVALIAIAESRWRAASADVNQPFGLFNYCNPISVLDPIVKMSSNEDTAWLSQEIIEIFEQRLLDERLLRKVIGGQFAPVRNPGAPSGSVSFIYVEMLILVPEAAKTSNARKSSWIVPKRTYTPSNPWDGRGVKPLWMRNGLAESSVPRAPDEANDHHIVTTLVKYRREVTDTLSDSYGLATTWDRLTLGKWPLDQASDRIHSLAARFLLEYLQANREYC